MSNLFASFSRVMPFSFFRRNAYTHATLKPELVEPFFLKLVAELPLLIDQQTLFDLIEHACQQADSRAQCDVMYAGEKTTLQCVYRAEGERVQLHFHSENVALMRAIRGEVYEFCAVNAGVARSAKKAFFALKAAD